MPGDKWQNELEKVCREIPVAAIFLGESGGGRWAEQEVQVLVDQAAKRDLRIIPVLLPGTSATPDRPFLDVNAWSDMREGLSEDRLDRLADGIRRGLSDTEVSAASQPPTPRLHNLPLFSLGSLFKGREDELDDLGKCLVSPKSVAAITQRQLIHGLGGIGKTRLAIEYAWRFGHLFSAVFFVPARSRNMFRGCLADLALPHLLNLPNLRAANEERRLFEVLAWLTAHDNWLMIIDNVDLPEAVSEVLNLLPSFIHGAVIITSRYQSWPPTVAKKRISRLTDDQSTDFLLSRTSDGRKTSPTDVQAALSLATTLEGLPLALEQAGAYINHHQASFSEYLLAWESGEEKVLSWIDPLTMQYPRAVATTWQASFDQLSPLAMSLLQIAAFYSSEPISRQVLDLGQNIIEEASVRLYPAALLTTSGITLNEALSQLVSLSLASRDQETFSIHRVVQEIVKARASDEQRVACTIAAVDLATAGRGHDRIVKTVARTRESESSQVTSPSPPPPVLIITREDPWEE